MSTITLRSTKGSPLTNTEVDNNFSNLNNDKLEKNGGTLSNGTVSNSAVSGGTVDGAPIGGTTPAAGSFTTLHTTQAITTDSTVDGRDVAADGSKLDGIEAGADVTDTTNVTAAGALMDSELTDIAAVKALDQGVATTDQPTWNGVDLAAISTSIADTAVDVFVYDTRKDSDGGAWRKRTQHTSWYNETLNTATRGSRREFPAVAVIVAESNKVTIYDGDDPDLPMWMVFNVGGSAPNTYAIGLSTANSGTCCAALNGIVFYGGNNGGYQNGQVISFVNETVRRYSIDSFGGLFKGNISQRNTGLGWTGTSQAVIVDYKVNDVAMTVLPNAPIDAATGLPIPTIAVATNGGVSVIKDDGAVVDLTYSIVNNASDHIAFTQQGGLSWFLRDGKTYYVEYDIIPSADSSTVPDTVLVPLQTTASAGLVLLPRGNGIDVVAKNDTRYIALDPSGYGSPRGGVVAVELAGSTSSANGYQAMLAYIMRDHNTGWMPGDIKGAWLSDTDATNVTGAELVTNGTFDTDTSGWGAVTATLSVVSNKLRISNSGANYGYAWQSFTTEVGKQYVFSLDYTQGTSASASMRVGTSQGGSQLGAATLSATGPRSVTFTATTTTTYILVINLYNSDGLYTDIDNVSVRLAEEDRSVNNKGLQVFGTITKTYVDA